MKTVSAEQATLDECVRESQEQRVVVTRDGVPVAVATALLRDVAIIWNVVSVAVGLALVGKTVAVAVQAGSGGDILQIVDAVVVTIDADFDLGGEDLER